MSQQPPNWQPGAPGQPQYPAPSPQQGYGGGYGHGPGPQGAYGPGPQGQPPQGGYAPGPHGGYGPGPYGPPPPYGAPPGHWPQQPPVQQPQSGVSLGRIILGVVLGIVIVISAGYVWISMGGSSSSSSLAGRLPETPKLSLRNPQIVTDEDLVVSAGGSQMRGFTIPSSRPVRVGVEGKQDTAKGFNVHVMDQDDWEKFKAGGEFRHVTALSAPKTRSFSQTATLPAGTWCVVVQNSENILNDMTVHVKVVVDPD